MINESISDSRFFACYLCHFTLWAGGIVEVDGKEVKEE